MESEQEHRKTAHRSVNCFWRNEDRTAGTGPASVVPGGSLHVLFVPRHEQTVATKGLDWEWSGRSFPDEKASGKPCSGPWSPGSGAFPSLRLSGCRGPGLLLPFPERVTHLRCASDAFRV